MDECFDECLDECFDDFDPRRLPEPHELFRLRRLAFFLQLAPPP
ncbi:MAG: hypothetical protein AB7N76_25335 [Planctomycetota bacterium]